MSFDSMDPGRRRVLLALAGAAVAPAGCAVLSAAPPPSIAEEPSEGLRPILAPYRVNKPAGTPTVAIDVHAHFFNARDVPVRGYVAGPVAHAKEGPLGDLLRALAPLAEFLGSFAPTARLEFDELVRMAGEANAKRLGILEAHRSLDRTRDDWLARASTAFFEVARGSEFALRYDALQAEARATSRGLVPERQLRSFGADSLAEAMRSDLARTGPGPRALMQAEARAGEGPPPYADGVLAFVGYMLSYRWMNLIAYQRAFTTEADAFGIDQVVGALVDFDHWLTPPPRTAHLDQVKVHQLLSMLSGGYMRPLAAYNPWSDAQDGGATLARVLDAIDVRGFVGAKIYPPNGYRPYGNEKDPLPAPPWGMPTGAALDARLLALWTECTRRGVPVMAHTGHSMGSSDAFEEMASPTGWEALVVKVGAATPARASLGHFGGALANYPWTEKDARLMERPEGAGLYADLGYWDDLRCPEGLGSCYAAARLQAAVRDHPVVADRVMYGSDWLMLSQERRWDLYPFELLESTRVTLDPDAFFAANARKCFMRLQRPRIVAGRTLVGS